MDENLKYKASGTQGELARIMLLINVVHNENMSLMKMFLPREKGKEITDSYKKQFEDVLKMDFYSDEHATTEQ